MAVSLWFGRRNTDTIERQDADMWWQRNVSLHQSTYGVETHRKSILVLVEDCIVGRKAPGQHRSSGVASPATRTND